MNRASYMVAQGGETCGETYELYNCASYRVAEGAEIGGETCELYSLEGGKAVMRKASESRELED